MATMSEKPVNVFGATLSRRQFVKDGRRARRGIQPGWHGASEGRYREGGGAEELARSQPAQFLD